MCFLNVFLFALQVIDWRRDKFDRERSSHSQREIVSGFKSAFHPCSICGFSLHDASTKCPWFLMVGNKLLRIQNRPQNIVQALGGVVCRGQVFLAIGKFFFRGVSAKRSLVGFVD